jgi:hypothetical protein
MSNSITIHIGARPPGDYLRDLHSAISEVKLLLFERRELDIDEAGTYALYTLTDLQQRIVKGGSA